MHKTLSSWPYCTIWRLAEQHKHAAESWELGGSDLWSLLTVRGTGLPTAYMTMPIGLNTSSDLGFLDMQIIL